MTEEELPFGELGDVMEKLVPIAAELVQAARDEGPSVVLGVMLQLRGMTLSPTVTAQLEQLNPGPVGGAFALVLAAMVNPDARMRALLGWTEELIDGRGAERVIDDKIRDSAARERARLAAAGVQTARAAATIADPVARAQVTTRDRMLRVVQGGRESA
jgi:hypothetical protein